MSHKIKYYVVWKGRRTGVFSTWEECAAQVQGLAGAQYKAFASRPAAEQAYREHYAYHAGKPASGAEGTSGKISMRRAHPVMSGLSLPLWT